MTVSYTPKVSLDVSKNTVKKAIQFDKLADKTPNRDRNNPFGGYSVTNKNSLVNELDVEITNAIIADFSTNSAFTQIGRKIENPDFIIKGEINRFYGKVKLTNFGLVTLATLLPVVTWYFGLPVYKLESEVEIKLNVCDKENNLMKSYSAIYKDKQYANLYTNKLYALPNFTNKLFSKTIEKLRTEITSDLSKME